ncbi:MAG: uracil-DNA glycosylase [Shimia sp.]
MILPRTGWRDLPFFTDTYPALHARLAREPSPLYPPEAARFRALDLCAPEDTRVVILGQDPYHTPGKADGLAFSIPRAWRGNTGALGNIFKEMRNDLDVSREDTDLFDLAAQGVLLLNTALTVPEGRPKAHAKHGWGDLVAQVIARTAERPTAYLFWGAAAQAHGRNLGPPHLVLNHTHPSPLSAHRGFFGSRPFSTIDRWLTDRGETPIDWAGGRHGRHDP